MDLDVLEDKEASMSTDEETSNPAFREDTWNTVILTVLYLAEGPLHSVEVFHRVRIYAMKVFHAPMNEFPTRNHINHLLLELAGAKGVRGKRTDRSLWPRYALKEPLVDRVGWGLYRINDAGREKLRDMHRGKVGGRLRGDTWFEHQPRFWTGDDHH